MSDDRFDQDLRAVLLEDAPGEVPHDLRRRVAAVSATHPVSGRVSGPSWRRPVTLWLGAGAALVLVLVAASWWFGPAAQQGVGGQPSSPPSTEPPVTLPPSIAVIAPSASHEPSPSSATSSPSMTPAPSGLIACLGTSSRARSSAGWCGRHARHRRGDHQHRRAPMFRPRNPQSSDDRLDRPGPDRFRGSRPERRATRRAGRQTDRAGGGRPGSHDRDGLELLRSGGYPADRHRLHAAGWCRRLVAVPGTGVSSDLAVPDCLGSAPATIAMTGWTK